jgi:hypothetical protein
VEPKGEIKDRREATRRGSRLAMCLYGPSGSLSFALCFVQRREFAQRLLVCVNQSRPIYLFARSVQVGTHECGVWQPSSSNAAQETRHSDIEVSVTERGRKAVATLHS